MDGCIQNIPGWGNSGTKKTIEAETTRKSRWQDTCKYAEGCEGAKDPQMFYNRCRYGEKTGCKYNPETKRPDEN